MPRTTLRDLERALGLLNRYSAWAGARFDLDRAYGGTRIVRVLANGRPTHRNVGPRDRAGVIYQRLRAMVEAAEAANVALASLTSRQPREGDARGGWETVAADRLDRLAIDRIRPRV